MKLYATVTSERASKGQGGNKEVVMELQIDPTERKMVGRVVMRCEEYGKDKMQYTIYYYPITEVTGRGGRVLLHDEIIEKANKQKDS